MTKGVTLLCIGQPARNALRDREAYAQWAYACSFSIKYHNPNLKIQLITNEIMLPLLGRCAEYVDERTIISDEDYLDEGKFSPGKAKLHLNKYLLFDHTVYIDVDSYVIGNIEYLFDLKNDYYCSQVGRITPEEDKTNKMLWAGIPLIREKYKLNGNIIPATNSSLQVIKRSETTKELFSRMQSAFDDKIPTEELSMTWGVRGKHAATKHNSGQPDELYLNIALSQMNIEPGFEKEPVFYSSRGNGRVKATEFEGYSILTFYGGRRFVNDDVAKMADDIFYTQHLKAKGTHAGFYIRDLVKQKYVDNGK